MLSVVDHLSQSVDDKLFVELTSSVWELVSLLKNMSSSKLPARPPSIRPSCSSENTESKNSELCGQLKSKHVWVLTPVKVSWLTISSELSYGMSILSIVSSSNARILVTNGANDVRSQVHQYIFNIIAPQKHLKYSKKLEYIDRPKDTRKKPAWK